jgi:hypothetical protein
MIITKGISTTREASFKEEKNTDSDIDEIKAKFMRRLKKELGKYQGKLPFKCFNYGKIGHFSSKCPHKKNDQNSDDEKKYKFKKYSKNKTLCANNDDSSEDTDTNSSCKDKVNDFILMDIGDLGDEYTGGDMNDE